MLRRNFPQNDSEAVLYTGFLKDDHTFCRLFNLKGSFNATLEEINVFLFDNGYCKLLQEDFDEEFTYEDEVLKVSKHVYKEQLVLCITKPKPTLLQVVQKLTAFRDARDWEQFHNSKDLALAISIEAGELLELFLWKGNEDFKEEKLREELADVFSFCLLLAEKHGLDPVEIITSKIQINAAKYPVAKAKGTAKKYNEL
jgi:NTP pyrophosphatase (non-canonical NTP hydrolase)